MFKDFTPSLWAISSLAIVAIGSAIAYSPWPALLLLGSIAVYLAAINQRLSISAPENAQGQLHDQTLREHQLLLESIHAYPMPFAIYDKEDRLVIWNEHYENIYKNLFSSISNKRDAKSLTYADLVRSNADDNLSGAELETFIQERVNRQRDERNQVNDRFYPDLGWYRVVKYLIPSGGVAGVAIDISESKQREADLLKEIELRQKLEVEIRRMANTDALTGIANRRHLLETAEHEYSRCILNEKPFTFLMIDIDNFKMFNDTYGHLFGDSVICNVADTLSAKLTSDRHMAGRMGGEEFAVLLPDTPEDESETIAENIRKAIENCALPNDDDVMNLSVSIGIAHRHQPDTTLLDLTRQADDALYLAKHAGRNQVSVAKKINLKSVTSGLN